MGKSTEVLNPRSHRRAPQGPASQPRALGPKGPSTSSGGPLDRPALRRGGGPLRYPDNLNLYQGAGFLRGAGVRPRRAPFRLHVLPDHHEARGQRGEGIASEFR
jgi:hypothetical protein